MVAGAVIRLRPEWRLLSSYRLASLPTALGVLGVLCLLLASAYLRLEVRLAVRSFDEELDHELDKRHT